MNSLNTKDLQELFGFNAEKNFEFGISTDSRAIRAGDVFLPIVGENFDGHNFIFDALQKGAELAFSQYSFEDLCKHKKIAVKRVVIMEKIDGNDNKDLEKYKSRIIKIENTLSTYHLLANHYRKKINPLVIGITGSSGKTTTKEMLRLVLEGKYRVHYSKANFNNEIGVPQTILEMPADTEILILEMGMRGLGQIEQLSKIAEPNIAIITNIGVAHIELLGSIDNIEKAKLEIVKYLRGTLIVDEKLYKKVRVNKILSFDSQARYKLKGLVSEGIHADANAVAVAAKELGFNDIEIQQGLDKYSPGRGRGSFHYDKDGNLFIDDTYNANPDSVKTNLDALVKQFPEENKILVLGKLLESSDELINKLLDYIKDLETKANLIFINAIDADIDITIKELQETIQRSTENELSIKKVILIKGSREARLERILEAIPI